MELRELRIVVAVADQGSVTQAATTLHMSASAVSHAVTALERELGTPLFHRLARGMALTAAGEAMIGAARRALREARAATEAVGAVDGLLAGNLSVVVLRMFTTRLADLIAAFARLHPKVVVTVHQPEGDVVVAQLVRSGECEIGVMRQLEAPDELEATPIADDQLMVIVAGNHPFAGRESISLRDLDGQRVVAPPQNSSLRAVFDMRFARAGVVPDVVVEAEHHEMVMELVRAGVGLTMASASSAALVTARGAVAVPMDPPVVHALALVMRRGALTPAGSAFRDLAVELLV